MSKNSNLHVLNYLEHILTAITRINHYIENLNKDMFLQNEMIQDAVIRNIEIIGEASRNIERQHSHFTIQYPEVPSNLPRRPFQRNANSFAYHGPATPPIGGVCRTKIAIS